jgi:ATP-dependent helicase/nuclease subunit A
MPDDAPDRLKAALSFSYSYAAATEAPSKQTATGRKGRVKDEEAAEDTQETLDRIHRTWRRPSFLDKEMTPLTYGNAMHQCLQFICYKNCGSTAAVQEEVARLVREGFLTAEQGGMVSCADIANFFETEEGQLLRTGAEHIREFKFSILDDASNYGVALEGEQVLLQGVVDCALLGEDGITVIDFKTDRVTENTLGQTVEQYRLQVQTYAEALSRIYKMPIKAKKLYFFRLNRFVDV